MNFLESNMNFNTQELPRKSSSILLTCGIGWWSGTPTQAPLATKPAVDLNMTTASWDAPLPFARAGKRLTRTGCSTPACRLLDQYMAGATDQPVITPDLECD